MPSIPAQAWYSGIGAAVGVVVLAIPATAFDLPGALPIWTAIGGAVGAAAGAVAARPSDAGDTR